MPSTDSFWSNPRSIDLADITEEQKDFLTNGNTIPRLHQPWSLHDYLSHFIQNLIPLFLKRIYSYKVVLFMFLESFLFVS